MKDLSFRFGRCIRLAREQRGLSQEQLAEYANLNRSYLGEIERGLVTPSLATLEKLAKAFNLPPSALLASCEPEQSLPPLTKQ